MELLSQNLIVAYNSGPEILRRVLCSFTDEWGSRSMFTVSSQKQRFLEPIDVSETHQTATRTKCTNYVGVEPSPETITNRGQGRGMARGVHHSAADDAAVPPLLCNGLPQGCPGGKASARAILEG